MDLFAGTFIIACWAAFLVYLVIAAMTTKRTVRRNRQRWRFWIVISVVILMSVLVSVFPALADRLSKASAGGSVPRDLAADIVTALGVATALWARIVLGGNWSSSAEIKEGQELVERGPYRYVRHPIYSGLLLMVVGLAVWYGPIVVLPLVVLFLVLWIRSRQEESLLTSYFPQAYPEYKRRTKALIPFVL
jgi:protein-S-isoprenylcysteine O-methyltransferase Ste14